MPYQLAKVLSYDTLHISLLAVAKIAELLGTRRDGVLRNFHPRAVEFERRIWTPWMKPSLASQATGWNTNDVCNLKHASSRSRILLQTFQLYVVL